MEAASLADLIEEQVARRSAAVAVVAASGHLSYCELDSWANGLAHRLQALGVGGEAVVGVCLGRSLEMTVDFLAVLKAGGAILPLDPSNRWSAWGSCTKTAFPTDVRAEAADGTTPHGCTSSGNNLWCVLNSYRL